MCNTVDPHYNEDIGTMKITLLYLVQETKKYNEMGPENLPCYIKEGFVISDLFIMRFHCIGKEDLHGLVM